MIDERDDGGNRYVPLSNLHEAGHGSMTSLIKEPFQLESHPFISGLA